MKQPIRVLHILQRMEAGGTQALLMNIYRNIDREKVQFDFLVMYPEKYFYDDEIVSMGGKIYYSNVRKNKNIFKFQNQLKKLIKENGYNIVHVHTYSIGYFALRTAKKCGVPVRIAHSHNNKTTHDKNFVARKILQKIYTIHATELFACSKEAGEYLYGKKEFRVIKNAINLGNYKGLEKYRNKKRKELGIDGNTFLVGSIGRLHAQKNQLFLIEIFAEIKKQKNNSKLLLIGDGPLKDKLVEKSKALGVKNDVFFLSNRKDIPELLVAMDIFVLPSVYEGLGIVAIEAQAASLPVVLSDGVSKEAIVTDNVNVVSLRKTAKEWAKQIISLKAIDANIEEKIKNSGFDIKSQALLVQKYYLEKSEGSDHE